MHFMRRLRKAKKEAAPMEKPDVVKTHLRNMIILPEMIGSMVGVYNGKTFNQVEIKVSVQSNLSGFACTPSQFLISSYEYSPASLKFPEDTLICSSLMF